jgi:heme exporter protein CcmD
MGKRPFAVTMLTMNGYGIYVWPSYAIMLIIFGINLWLFFREKKQIKKTIQRYLNHSHES